MEEATLDASAYRLRLLFIVLLSHCELQNPSALFETYWRKMAEKWIPKYGDAESKLICKEWIRRRVRANYGSTDDPLFHGLPADQQVPPEFDVPQKSPSLAAAEGESQHDS
jgi:hypothetical protein